MERLDGRALSQEMRGALKERVSAYTQCVGEVPCLAVVLIGEDPASHVYVRNKIKACASVGIKSIEKKEPADISQEALLKIIKDLNQDPSVNAILVQLPLPKHIDESAVIAALDPIKDADGLCIENLGLLFAGQKRVAPCTPHGVIRLLKKHSIPMAGQNAVVIGRSQIVGKPMAVLLLEENATVTLCHSHTKNLKEHLNRADIVVVAAGKPEFLGKEDFAKGSVVVDVGIHRKDNGKLCGDVRATELEGWAKAVSPVPGGVGPMTIAMLLENTLHLSELQKS